MKTRGGGGQRTIVESELDLEGKYPGRIPASAAHRLGDPGYVT